MFAVFDLSRERAYELLGLHNHDESHVKHALAVEAAMRYFARHFGEDEDLWGIVGLLHDLDWEECPEEHPKKGAEWLKEAGYPEEVIRGVLAHAWELTGVEPKSLMEKVIYAVDELTGFVIAVALVRPSRSLSDLTAKSVMKKWKDKAFAKGVNREVIEKGAQLLEMPLAELIEHVIEALRPIEQELGLG
ncbi:MAG TPA: HDIG domain-containing protein [Acetomicrobium flavidum]|uniref:HDIG domain-containing metalloprotein n=1 Tax=Acetomicrobium flavidum TaxID=49896 RepID=UPI00059DA270|nr:HDIG domain-containing protein [Acetomicrobium flavidum]HOM31051.1 HDIG domain-containing protein [Acetomicrobium flavidum]HPU68993.1 HDIG domain-containing protein [Acetomicrobium flavidum]